MSLHLSLLFILCGAKFTGVIKAKVIVSLQGALYNSALSLKSYKKTLLLFDFISLAVVLNDGILICAKAVVYGAVTWHSHSILNINAVAESNLQAYIIYKEKPAVSGLKRVIN